MWSPSFAARCAWPMLLAIAAPAFAASSDKTQDQAASDAREPDPPTVPAADILQTFETDCTADGGRLWGMTLCGPFLLITEDGAVTANAPDASGRLAADGPVWTARLTGEEDWPSLSNTSASWSGTDWAVALVEPDVSPEEYARIALHENFHRIQPALGIDIANVDVAVHLDEVGGRLWLRLGLRALAAALRAPDDDMARAHLAAAVTMTAYRHRLFGSARKLEAVWERNEGLPEYTGWRLAGVDNVEAAFADALDKGDGTDSFARSFAYLTGPAWGLTLDRLGLEWRSAMLAQSADFLAIAADALDVDPVPDEAAAIAAGRPYGYDRLVVEERERAEQLAAKRAEYRARFVDGPRLILPLNNITFNPQTVTSLGEAGEVYGTLTDSGPWGSLTTEQGALVVWANREVIVGAEGAPSGSLWETPRWRLQLSKGWRVVPRGADFAVVEE